MKTLAIITVSRISDCISGISFQSEVVFENTFEGLNEALDSASRSLFRGREINRKEAPIILQAVSPLSGLPVTEIFTLSGDMDEDLPKIDTFLSELSVAIDEEWEDNQPGR